MTVNWSNRSLGSRLLPLIGPLLFALRNRFVLTDQEWKHLDVAWRR